MEIGKEFFQVQWKEYKNEWIVFLKNVTAVWKWPKPMFPIVCAHSSKGNILYVISPATLEFYVG